MAWPQFGKKNWLVYQTSRINIYSCCSFHLVLWSESWRPADQRESCQHDTREMSKNPHAPTGFFQKVNTPLSIYIFFINWFLLQDISLSLSFYNYSKNHIRMLTGGQPNPQWQSLWGVNIIHNKQLVRKLCKTALPWVSCGRSLFTLDWIQHPWLYKK